MDVEPGGERGAPARRDTDATNPPAGLDLAFTEHERDPEADVLSVSTGTEGVDQNGNLAARERALRLLADERAVLAESREASLQATLAVVTSVAEASIDAAAALVDEARRYAQVVAEAGLAAPVSSIEVTSADALRVIAEARAAVAELRADLLQEDQGDDPVDDPGTTVAADHEVTGNRRSRRWRRPAGGDPGEAPSATVREPGGDSSHQAGPAWVPPPPEGAR